MKKVLIISYYWPPAGGSGVQRWLKFAKYLPSNNWQPIIYTPENPYFDLKDEDLYNDIPVEAEIWKTPVWEPYALKDKFFGKAERNQSVGVISNKNTLKNRLFNWIRGNFFIPDPKVFWVKPSVKILIKKIKEESIEHIITTGPPHSMHLIGLGLKKSIPKLKWIADFRDPWTELDLLEEFHLSTYSKRRHQNLERKVLKNADSILTVSETWMIDFKRLGANRVELITNGYDEDDFDCKPKKTNKFIIGHYGLLNHLRNARNLWKTLNSLCEENTDFNSKLEIHFSGNVDAEVMSEIKSHTYLKDKVIYLGYLSHAEVLKEYNQTSVLLLLLFNSKSGTGNYPGKLFEYFAAKKPILAFGPDNSDTERIIKKTNTGIYFSYTQISLKSDILALFNNDHQLNFENKDVFSRKKITEDLCKLLNNI
jgi:glycosyltransferase involved in cell wall biosynthesis